MDGDRNIGVYFLEALTILAVGVGLYAGWKVLPYYLASHKFEDSVAAQASIFGGSEEAADTLQEAIYRDAQAQGLPVRREDIQVEDTPSGSHVDVEYTRIADLGFGQLPLHFHAQYPQPDQAISPQERGILAAIGLLLGLYWFFKGFGLFQEYKVIADTPLVPVRSVAMGWVQIRGKAVGEKTMRSPVSNQPCFFYKVDIERWSAGRAGSGCWSPYLSDQGSVGFYLEDETGKVLIDPRGAELDLEQSSQCELSSHDTLPLDAPWQEETPGGNPPGSPPPYSELRRYVARVARGMNTAVFQGGDLPSPGNPGVRPHKPRRSMGGMLGPLLNISPVTSLGGIGSGAAPGDYRLTEYCVVPESEYDITGTCAMNPHGTSDLDRQLITRGLNDRTFLISDQTEKGLEQDLHIRAWRHIVGGGLLAVVGMAVLLEAMGLIV
jgi:hypothetical protein